MQPCSFPPAVGLQMSVSYADPAANDASETTQIAMGAYAKTASRLRGPLSAQQGGGCTISRHLGHEQTSHQKLSAKPSSAWISDQETNRGHPVMHTGPTVRKGNVAKESALSLLVRRRSSDRISELLP
jgi:hypothetical protein